MAERQYRASVRLVPRAITLLEQMRGGLLESQEDFASRKKETDEQRVRLDQELHQQRQLFDKFRDDLRRDVRAICDHYQPLFATASDDLAIDQVSGEFTSALSTKVSDHFATMGQQWDNDVGGIDANMQRLLKDSNRKVELGATLTTAALFAAINPATGWAATAGEVTGGAAVRAAGARAAIKTVAVEGIKRVGRSVLTTLHEINLVNIASDYVGEWWKNGRIAGPMDHICREFSAQAAREIEAYFESEVFQPLEHECEEMQRALSQIESERRTDLADRNANVSRIQADIDRLRKI